MNKVLLNKIASTLLISVLFVLPLLLVGCNNSNIGYRGVIVTKGSFSFSFSYPDCLKDRDNSTLNRSIDEFIFLSDSEDIGIDGQVHDKKLFRMTISDFTSGIVDARTYIDKAIGTLTSGNYPIEQVEILERSGKTIAGEPGELLHFSFLARKPSSFDGHLTSCRYLAFVYGNYIWTLDYFAYIELENEASLEFEHIIKSFKFQKE
jgi:hypothetical protein